LLLGGGRGRWVVGGLVVIVGDGDLVAAVEPAAEVDEFAAIAAKGIWTSGVAGLGVDGFFTDGAEHGE
jgi:hypothetical protein